MKTDSNQPKRILIILPRQLGDILLGSSLAFALRSSFPQAKIVWLAHPMGRQLLEGHPALNEVFYYPVWKPGTLKSWMKNPAAKILEYLRYLKSEISMLTWLRSTKFNLVVDSICTPKTALMSFATRAQMRHGLRTRWNRNWAYTWLCSTSGWSGLYAAHARLNLLAPLLDPQLLNHPPEHWLQSWLPSSQAARQRVSSILTELSLEKGSFAVLSPTSRRPLRQWPAESFIELAIQLIEEDGLKICWFWGPGEFDFTHKIHQNLQEKLRKKGLSADASCLPPLLSLSEAALFSGEAAVWIGNTNGLSHVAVAGGARTVQIYGPTSSRPWTHPDAGKHIAVQRTDGCVRCESNHCRTGTHECMKQLNVSDVLQAVRKIRKVSGH